MQPIEITIPLAPVTKKNHGQIVTMGGKPRLLPSKQYREYEAAAGNFLKRLEISTPVNLKCLFYMPTRRIVDLVGLLQAADDVLTVYGVILDDNSRIVVSHDGSWVLYDKENPRTEIEITEVK